MSDQVGQRLPGPAPQVAQLVASGHQPGVALVAVGRPRSEVVEGVDDAALVDDVVLGDPRVGVAGATSSVDARSPAGRRGLRLCAGPSGEQRGPLAEPGEVARPEAPARTTQQPQQRRAGRGVAEHLQRGDDVGHLGAHQQAAEADDLDRDAALAQRLLETGEGGALAGRGRPSRPRRRRRRAPRRAGRPRARPRRRPSRRARTRPDRCRSGRARARSGRCARPSTGRPAATAFATVRMASPLRNDWVSPLSRMPPKSAPNRWRLPALAPRQP